METKINIADILKDKPVGLKFYSNTFGYISFNGVHKDKVYFFSEDTNAHSVKPNGKMYDGGECIIFPSKEMRDWEKFSWKKGDVLVNEDGSVHIIFEEFEDDAYTMFSGKYYYSKDGKKAYSYFRECDDVITEEFTLETEDAAKTYIKTIEERLGGKLNLETLEIEKAQPDFKDGDIVSLEIRYIDSEDVIAETYILHGDYHNGENLNFYAGYRDNITDKVIYNSFVRPDKTSVRKELLRYATKEEKQQLFDALEKEGKAWDAEKKQIVDLKPNVELKPFDKVLVRNDNIRKWEADLFGFKNVTGHYHCVGGTWLQCISYIGNEHLLGTTNNVEG